VIYFDANASEILRPAAREATLAALDVVGNPASIHAAGRAARRLLEQARAQVAALAGVAPADVIFCSGGTEANAAAIAALAPGRVVLTGATEHPCVLAATPASVPLRVHPDGTLDLAALQAVLAGNPPALVCLMLANNETGVIHPIAEAARLCRAHGALLHVDAVQAGGRIPIDMASLGAATLALSAHKLGGPQGVGALVTSPGLHIAPLFAGGGQERGRRGGTPALSSIAGFGAAAAAARVDCNGGARLASLRDRLEQAAISVGATVCGSGPRLPNTSCLALPGVPAETQVITLDLAGIAVSAGAACSSGRISASHVLQTMGFASLAACAIRVSLPWNATAADADVFVGAYAAMADRLARASTAPISAA
jgi:cysteine desulfurase